MARYVAVIITILILTTSLLRADTTSDKQITELKAQITLLKEQLAQKDSQIAKLQQQLAQQQNSNVNTEVEAAQNAARLAAKKRMAQDYARHTRDQIRAAEDLYQVANKNWRTPEAKASLEKMIQQYPDLNRTGCATLYLARMSQNPQREQLFKQAISQFSDCYYGDGVCVGAYARYLLAADYFAAGNKAEAQKLFDELRKTLPKAIDHHGELLLLQLPAEEQVAKP